MFQCNLQTRQHKDDKDDKIVNDISNNDWHECSFFDALHSWWHHNENVMKRMITFADEIDEVTSSPIF
jgi:hypothetical protein